MCRACCQGKLGELSLQNLLYSSFCLLVIPECFCSTVCYYSKGQIKALIGSAWMEDLHSSFFLLSTRHMADFLCPAAKLVYSFRRPSAENIEGVTRLPTVRPSSDSPIFGSKNRHEITVISRDCGRRSERGAALEPPPICGFSTGSFLSTLQLQTKIQT